MPQPHKFEDLFVWQKSMFLAKEIFILFENCTSFALRNQIERAVISISANIAEGYELGTDKQFVRHLFISKGSCAEVRSLLLLAKELHLFSPERLEPFIQSSGKLSVMLFNLICTRGWNKSS